MLNRFFPNTCFLVKLYFILTFGFYILDYFIPLEARGLSFYALQGLPILIGAYYILHYLKLDRKSTCGQVLLLFILFMINAALISPYFNPNCIYILRCLTTFYIFYVTASNGEVSKETLITFANFFFVYSVITLILNKQVNAEEFEGMTIGSNSGYSFVVCMLCYAMCLREKTKLYLFLLSFLLVILSFKRGAILSGSFVFVIFLKDMRKNLSSNMIMISSIIMIAFTMIFYPMIKESIEDRFNHLETSGRDVIYGILIQGWLDSDFYHQLFGYGFFDTLDFLELKYVARIYAHNDWLELLHDFGIFGVLFYWTLFLSFFSNSIRRNAKSDNILWTAYLSTIAALFIRATFSGAYVSKECHAIFMLIGFIQGLYLFRQQKSMNKL